MSFTIDKGIPIPQRSKARGLYDKTLSAMEVGDSVLFPWHTRDGKYVVSKKNQK